MRNVRTAVLLLVSACGSGGTTLPPPEPLEIWTKVTGGPTAFGLSSDTTPTIELASNLPDALFEVSLDDGPSRLVASPYTLAPLADGPHRLEAYASDGLGTRDFTPVSRSWVTDTVPPAVAATFPPPLSATTEARVAVCGTASDDRRLGSVSVNGVSAFSTDGFRTWRAVVPVTTGMNDLRLEATDAAGNRIDVPGPSVETLARGLEDPIALVMDGNTPLALEAQRQALVRVEIETGEIAVVSDAGTGSGEMPLQPVQFAANPDGGSVVVFDAYQCRLFEIDTASGDRRMVVDATAQDIFVGRPGLLCCDGNKAYVQGPPKVRLLEIDLATGEMREVRPGYWGKEPMALEYDPVHDRLLAVDAGGSDALLAIDPATGDITTVSAGTNDLETQLGGWRGMALNGDAAWVVAGDRKGLVEIDLVTGERTYMPLTGTDIYRPLDIRLDTAGETAFVLDAGLDMVVSIDLETGETTPHPIAGTTVGAGEPLGTLNHAVSCRPGEPQVVVLDTDLRCLVAIDCETTDRTVVADVAIGTGPPLDFAFNDDGGGALVLTETDVATVEIGIGEATIAPEPPDRYGYADPVSVVWDADGDGPLVLNQAGMRSTVYSVNMETGARANWYLPVDPPGPGMAFNPATGTLYTADSNGWVLAVHRTPTLLTIKAITSPYRGTGPALQDPIDIAYDRIRNRLIVLDAGRNALMEVGLANGNRRVLCDGTCGVGPSLEAALGLAHDGSTNTAFVTLPDRLLTIDLTRGDRVIIAK